MKFQKLVKKQRKFSRRTTSEDMRYLQKKITGRSVYRYIEDSYSRSPKHKNRRFSY